jgi:hypothetical protein
MTTTTAHSFGYLEPEEKLARTCFWVEGNSHRVWSTEDEYAERAKREGKKRRHHAMEQVGIGFWTEVGKDHGRPVCISVFWYFVDGIPVAFWEPTSRIVNYDMIEKYLAQYGHGKQVSFEGYQSFNTSDETNAFNMLNGAQALSDEIRKHDYPFFLLSKSKDIRIRQLGSLKWVHELGRVK